MTATPVTARVTQNLNHEAELDHRQKQLQRCVPSKADIYQPSLTNPKVKVSSGDGLQSQKKHQPYQECLPFDPQELSSKEVML